MIFNDEKFDIKEIEAIYDNYIKISSINNIELYLSFNEQKLDLNTPINESINLIEYLYWDTTIKTDDVIYVFDITKDEITLTKLNDNEYKIEVNVEKPDMIYSRPFEKEFKNIKIDGTFSFIDASDVQDEKPKFVNDKKYDYKELMRVLDNYRG